MQSPIGGSLEAGIRCDLSKKKITIAALTVRPLERVDICSLGGATPNIFFVLHIFFTNEF